MISEEHFKMNKLNKIFNLLEEADSEKLYKFLLEEFEDTCADLIAFLKDKE